MLIRYLLITVSEWLFLHDVNQRQAFKHKTFEQAMLIRYLLITVSEWLFLHDVNQRQAFKHKTDLKMYFPTGRNSF